MNWDVFEADQVPFFIIVKCTCTADEYKVSVLGKTADILHANSTAELRELPDLPGKRTSSG